MANEVPPVIVTVPSKKFDTVLTARTLEPVANAPCLFVVSVIVPDDAGVADVVEVTPAYDHAEITSLLANRIVLEALSSIALRKRGEKYQPTRNLLDR